MVTLIVGKILAFLFGKEHTAVKNAGWVTLALIFGLILLVGIGVRSCWVNYQEEQARKGVQTGEKAISNANLGVEVEQGKVERAEKGTKSAQDGAKEAGKGVKDARDANYNGISAEEANKRRCEAYPESSECQ